MRKTYHILILLILHSSLLYAQENAISISNFTVKNQLPPGISEWGNTPGALLLVAQNNSWGDRPVKLLIAVKKGDNKICGIADGIPLDYFKTGSFQTKDLLAALGNCEALPPGDYTLCARFRGMSDNRQWVDISTEVCKPFTVVDGNADSQKYQRPTLVAAANNKVFTEKEANAPITLRCTPVVPKPQEPVIYHYRIWQVAAGQTPVQAMNGSQPVVEKEVENLTQTNITSGLFPCSPNCQFVWTVQATNREGKPYGENNGTSDLGEIYFDNDDQNKTSNLTKTADKNANVNDGNNPQNRQDPNAVPVGLPEPGSCAYITPWYTGGNSNPLNSTAGTCTNQDFILKANNNKALWIKPNGYIGIGTPTPTVNLDLKGSLKIEELTNSNTALPLNIIQGSAQWEGIRFTSQSLGKTAFEVRLTGGTSTNSRFLTFGSGKTYIGQFSNLMNNALANDPYLTIGQPTKADKAFNIVDNTNLALPVDYFTVYGDGRTLIKSTNSIPFSLSNGVTGSFYNYQLKQSNGNVDMWTLNNLFSYGFGIDDTAVGHIWADVNQKHQVINFKMSSFGSSQVWIGDLKPTGTHSNFRLAVDGKLVAKEIIVTQQSWADYVFDKNYKLNSLDSVESYIKAHHRLPNVPDSKEIAKEGVHLGEISKLQMEKIEELTLYVIELKKEIDALKKEMKTK